MPLPSWFTSTFLMPNASSQLIVPENELSHAASTFIRRPACASHVVRSSVRTVINPTPEYALTHTNVPKNSVVVAVVDVVAVMVIVDVRVVVVRVVVGVVVAVNVCEDVNVVVCVVVVVGVVVCDDVPVDICELV